MITFIECCGSKTPHGTDISDIKAFNAAILDAEPGDIIFLSAETSTNWGARLNISGAENNPVVISGSRKAPTGFTDSISNKASGIVYRKNHFENCAGAIVMQGGNECKISGNEFLGGHMSVRINGTRHHVYNNIINNTDVGISLQYSSGVEFEPAHYMAVSLCVIENNSITSSRECGIKTGANKGNTRPVRNPEKHAKPGTVDRQIYPPVNNKILSNTITVEHDRHIIIDEAPDNLIEGNVLTKT